MKSLKFRLALVPAAAVIFAAVAAAQQTIEPAVPQAAAIQQEQREIVVSLEDHKLALIENGQVKKVYAVAVGKASTPSPVGTFTIQRRVANPTYHHDGKTVLPGPNNPVGTRWMGLSKTGYGIHGTNEPKSIGKAASHGCIRMAKADLEEFYPMVAVGDQVRLIGHRDEETARLFGPAEMPTRAADAQPMLTARTDAPPAPSEAAPATNNVPAPAGATTTMASLGRR
jgi:lipoprotein-anchoring transpeptidase ErfK/SrfK